MYISLLKRKKIKLYYLKTIKAYSLFNGWSNSRLNYFLRLNLCYINKNLLKKISQEELGTTYSLVIWFKQFYQKSY